MFRKEILAKLQVKKAGSLKKLSQKGLDLLLDKLEAKITSEESIDGTIDDLDTGVFSFDDMVELVQKESDRKARSVKTNLEKDFDFVAKKKADDDDDDDDDEPIAKKKPGQPADMSKMIADAVTAAMAPFAALTKTIQVGDTRSKLKAAAKLKGIPEDWVDDYHIGDDFNEEEAVAKLDTKWTNAKQLAVNAAIGEGTVLKGNLTAPNAFEDAIKKYGETVAPKDSGINIQEM
jgi:hypothetical protein